MKFPVWILSAGLALGAAPPMPEWQPDDLKALKKGDLVPGLLLLTEDRERSVPVAPEGPEPTPEELAEASKPSPVVAEKYLEGYFAKRPEGFLVDPQGLLGTKEHRDRAKFLDYHSGDSRIDLFVYLFDGHDGEQLARARERWKAEKAAGHDVTYWQQTEDRKWVKKA